ncbi:hypothetical protein AAFF_G00417550 [Aldrovandia affinis]|uniref:Uncharacterized protein n=1 Tax=Aldrovandia affinis TaxID=143900 RepID=A0AAD7WJ50_9TELE|nr:hypothetical protein AAFF_G00417550 [Aldrovandia affinis]
MERFLGFVRQIRWSRRRKGKKYRPEEDYHEGYEDVYYYTSEHLHQWVGGGGAWLRSALETNTALRSPRDRAAVEFSAPPPTGVACPPPLAAVSRGRAVSCAARCSSPSHPRCFSPQALC